MNVGMTNAIQGNIIIPGILFGAPASTDYVDEPAVNTAAVITVAAPGNGMANVVGSVEWSYDDDPVAGSLSIQDGVGDVVFKVDVTLSGPGGFVWFTPKQMSANTDTIVTLAAAGAAVSGIVNVGAWSVTV
ncbi:MAG: hypothetical protein MUP90_11445 [Gammaproteobacteria bacterium]|nr:hypothetical protein [Gammaproteobacteria bacterium]